MSSSIPEEREGDAASRPGRGLVLSCEHGGYDVPAAYAGYFRGAEEVLRSHRGWDPGTLELGRRLSAELAAPLVATKVSRLVVEVNRSPGHPRLFSEYTRDLPPDRREELVARYHRPHREAVEAAVRERMAGGATVLHLALHSFTPVLDGRVREVDVGVLYDPRRAGERSLCERWTHALRGALPDLRIRRNAPYRGWTDGLTTSLRRRLPEERYLGVELELGQGLLGADGRFPEPVVRAVAGTFSAMLA